MAVESSCWPEQQAVDAWLKEQGISLPHKKVYPLKIAVTKPRIEHQKSLIEAQDRIKELEGAIRYALNPMSPRVLEALEEALKPTNDSRVVQEKTTVEFETKDGKKVKFPAIKTKPKGGNGG